jgi:PST family polysaccharide transporter
MAIRVYKNFFFLFIIQFSNYVLPFLVIPLLTRTLGVEGFGKYVFYIGIANFLLVFIRFGFEFSATRQISIHSEDKNKVGEIVSAVIQIKVLLLLLTIFLYYIVISFLKPDEQAQYLLLGGVLLLVGQTLLPVWYFQGMQQMKFVTLYTVITKITYVALLFLLIRNKDDYGIGVVVYGGAFFVAGLISILHVIKQVTVSFVLNLSLIKSVFLEALPFFTSRIFVTAYTSSMVPLLGFIGGPAQVAIYSASEKLYLAAQSAMYPLANALYPHMAKDRDMQLFKRLFLLAMVVVVFGGSIGYFAAPYLILFLFGNDFIQSTEIFNLHIVALVFVFPSLLLGYPLLAALGFSKEANLSVIIGAVVFFIIALFGYLSGVVDTQYFVWAVVFAEASVFILRVYFALTRINMADFKKVKKNTI